MNTRKMLDVHQILGLYVPAYLLLRTKQCQHHLIIAGCGTSLFWSERWWMFPLLTHAFSLWNIVQTPGLVFFDNTIQKLISLSFTPQHMLLERYPCKFPTVCCLHALAPILQKLSSTPELACWCEALVTHWYQDVRWQVKRYTTTITNTI
jgi:hypothetical protein